MKKYETITIEVVELGNTDVITTSGAFGTKTGDGVDLSGENELAW